MAIPGPLRNFILMVVASVIIFLLLSYIDEYENLIAPFSMDSNGR